MKTLVLLPTGIADVPVEALDGRTPLQAAHTPGLDRLARAATLGLVRQVPEGLPDTSEIAVLSALGFDPRGTRIGRGAIEAAGMGVDLEEQDLAFRLNFVSTFRGCLVDFNAGHIGGVEARLLIEALSARFAGPDAPGGGRFRFHAGLGYRNLLVVRDGRELAVETVPPQEVQGHPIRDYLPYGPDAAPLVELLDVAAEVLGGHDINRVRVDLGENPADRIWLWGPGTRCDIEPFELRTGRTLAVIAAVPLVRGLGRLLDADVPVVPGATGYYDTDWSAKLRAALAALDDHDVVLLHLAAANEACHATDVRLKLRVIEEIDRWVVGPLLSALARRGDTRLLLTTDHMTSSTTRVQREARATHVPFALWDPAGEAPGEAARFTEEQAAATGFVVEEGHSLIEHVFAPGRTAATRAAPTRAAHPRPGELPGAAAGGAT